MSAGPLRQITAMLGLLALAPIAILVLTSALSPEEAALRAIVVVVAVLVVGNIARAVLTQMLYRVERALPEDVPGTISDPGSSTSPSRRDADQSDSSRRQR